jgi:hypothetical protein
MAAPNTAVERPSTLRPNGSSAPQSWTVTRWCRGRELSGTRRRLTSEFIVHGGPLVQIEDGWMARVVWGVHAGPVTVRHPLRAGVRLVALGVVLAVVAEFFWLGTGGYEYSASGTPTQEQWAEIQWTNHLAAAMGVSAVMAFAVGLSVVAATVVRQLHRQLSNALREGPS